MNFKRRLPRIRQKVKSCGRNQVPNYFDLIHHTRPRRRSDKKGEYRILNGSDPENMIWALGNNRPTEYYW